MSSTKVSSNRNEDAVDLHPVRQGIIDFGPRIFMLPTGNHRPVEAL